MNQKPINIVRKISSPQFTPRLVEGIWQTAAKYVKYPENFSVNVITVNEPTIQRLNKDYRSLDAVTDVLSFTYSPEQGEIVICYPYATKQAKIKQISLQRELQWLFLHGLLHVLGYDHETAEDAKIMRPLERIILKAVA